MKKIIFFITLMLCCTLFSCTENFSNGERIGLVTQFSKAGAFWKSWEGHLNMTQTGMNSSQAFDFSIDNDNEPPGLVEKITNAAKFGWKVQLNYHETMGYNWFSNRGETNHFVTECIVLDSTPMKSIFNQDNKPNTLPGIRDTIWVVIQK